MTDKQNNPDPIAHAARLLREAAEELRQAHAYNCSEGWENETDAKEAYDEHIAAAQALEDWEAAVGAGGVQALSASPPSMYVDGAGIHAEDGASAVIRKLDARFHIVTFKAVDAAAASPTPPAEQAAPKAAPVTQQAGDVVAYLDVGAGGYLDLGSELSEDALQQLPKGRHALVIAGTYGIDGYVAAPQPSPTTKPAPQQEAQEPCPTCVALARAVMLDQVSFDRKPDCYGIRQITDDEGIEEWADIRTSPDVAREEANDMMATGRGEIYEVVSLWTTPQPAPAPLSDDVVRDAAFDAVRKKLCALPRFSFLSDGYGVRRVPDKSGSWIAFDAAHALFDPVAVDAALAAQGGK